MDYFILCMLLLVTIMLFFYYFYLPSLHKSVNIKKYWHTNNTKIDELKKLVFKIVLVIILMTIKIEDFDFDNILFNE